MTELYLFAQSHRDWHIGEFHEPRTKVALTKLDCASNATSTKHATTRRSRLTAPLQFELYVTRAFEEGFRVGQKPVDVNMINDTLAPDLDGLEARLTRNGYNAKMLTEMLGAKPKEVRAFLGGHLSLERTLELYDHLLAAGAPV